MSFYSILAQTIPVFLMIGIGALARSTKIIEEQAERSIMRLVLNVLYPCLILSKVPGNESLQQVGVVALALACGAGMTLTGMAVAVATGYLAKVPRGPQRNTFALSTAVQNYGFIPIPLIAGLFPEEIAQETLGVLFIHNLGLELALWTVGIVLVSGSASGSLRRLINGPTVAIVVGLTVNYTGIYRWMPGPLAEFIQTLGACAVPISLILVGASLAGVMLRETWVTQWRVILGSVGVRFAVMPLAFAGIASLVSGYSQPLTLVLLVEAAMPAAVFPIVIAKHFGGQPTVAVQVCLATSILSLVLTPLILTLLLPGEQLMSSLTQ